MKVHSDAEVHHAVVEALYSDPHVDNAVVGVLVRQGVVTLTGMVGDDAKRLVAEEATRRVEGVRTVINQLEVRPSGD